MKNALLLVCCLPLLVAAETAVSQSEPEELGLSSDWVLYFVKTPQVFLQRKPLQGPKDKWAFLRAIGPTSFAVVGDRDNEVESEWEIVKFSEFNGGGIQDKERLFRFELPDETLESMVAKTLETEFVRRRYGVRDVRPKPEEPEPEIVLIPEPIEKAAEPEPEPEPIKKGGRGFPEQPVEEQAPENALADLDNKWKLVIGVGALLLIILFLKR